MPERDAVKQAVFDTLEANNMRDGVHIRLTLTRGEKSTSGMDPRLNVHGCTLVVLPEYKGAVYGDGNLKLITSSVRRNGPSFLDSKIHHNNLLNNILAKIQANHAGADDAIMLDDRGFLAETNATNVFLIRDGVLCTPFGHACLPGITRAYTLNLASTLGIPIKEGDFSLTELYTADEAFTTGTMGGLAHIAEVDGRRIGPVRRQGPGPVTRKASTSLPQPHSKRSTAIHPMSQFLLPSCRVALAFALGTLFGWGLGQHLQDVCAPNVIRPTLNAPDQVSAFLDQLHPIAHASRLLANGAGCFWDSCF